MKVQKEKIDIWLLTISILLISFGFIVFISASLWMSDDVGNLMSTILKQFIVGIIIGGIGCFILSKINYSIWKKYAFWIFLLGLIITALTLVPGIGISHKGGARWLGFGGFEFQPVELLKISYIIYLAAWLSTVKNKAETFRFGFLPFLIISLFPFLILILQPDHDGILVMLGAGSIMLFISGIKMRYVIIGLLLGVMVSGLAIYHSSYLRDRFYALLEPQKYEQTTAYQTKQSLIAIGSGGIDGRGFGKGIQKHMFLPEPVGDSIFAVAGEEFGLLGTYFLVILYLLLGMRGLKIARYSKDNFGKILAVGIVSVFLIQAFVNIGSMTGIFILSGLPLPFVSHGGTALLSALLSLGILFNISRYKKEI